MLTLIIVIVLLLTGLLMPKNSKVSILGWIYLGWISLTAPTNYLGDYLAYKSVYNDLYAYQGIFESGYTFLEKIGNQSGLVFDQFRLLFVAVTIILFYIGVSRFTKNHALFLAVYIIAFYSYDLIQMRSQFMIGLVLVAFSSLIGEGNTKIKVVIATMLIYLAAQIHSSGYIFLFGIILFLSVKQFKQLVQALLPLTLITSILIPLLFKSSLFMSFVNLLGSMTGRNVLTDKLLVLFTGGVSSSLKLWYLVPLVLAWGIIKIVTDTLDSENVPFSEKQKYRILISGSLIGFIGFALLSVAPDYSRLFRHGMTFVIVLAAFFIEQANQYKNLSQKRIIVTCLIILFSGFSFYATYRTWGPYAQEAIPFILKIY